MTTTNHDPNPTAGAQSDLIPQPQRLRDRPLSQRTLGAFFIAALGLWLGLGSCTYHERFIIRIDEGNSFPCVGVARFSFVLEALEQTQVPLSSDRVTDNFLDANLFWRTDTGGCQIPNDSGILLKNIPYGGQRKMLIQAFDSSQELVSMGSSQPFTLEASGDNVQDVIKLPLLRGCQSVNKLSGNCDKQAPVGFGTLIIRFEPPNVIQTGARKLIFQIKDEQTEGIIRRIDLQDAIPPESIMLTNLPSATNKAFELFSLDNDKRVLQTWVGVYSIIAQPSPATPAYRTVPNPKPTP